MEGQTGTGDKSVIRKQKNVATRMYLNKMTIGYASALQCPSYTLSRPGQINRKLSGQIILGKCIC